MTYASLSRIDSVAERTWPRASSFGGRTSRSGRSQPPNTAYSRSLGWIDPSDYDSEPPLGRVLGFRSYRECQGPDSQILRSASRGFLLAASPRPHTRTDRLSATQFVNFERLDDAVSARKALNGREILGNQIGPVRIGFAKVPTKVATAPFGNGDVAQTAPQNGIGSYPHVYDALSHISGVTGVPVEKQLADGQVQDYRSNMLVGLVADEHYATAHMFANGTGSAPVETTPGSLNEMQLLMRELSQGDDELEEHVAAVAGTSEHGVKRAAVCSTNPCSLSLQLIAHRKCTIPLFRSPS